MEQQQQQVLLLPAQQPCAELPSLPVSTSPEAPCMPVSSSSQVLAWQLLQPLLLPAAMQHQMMRMLAAEGRLKGPGVARFLAGMAAARP